MAVNLSPLAGAGWQFFDNNGVILSGGLLYTYAAGTTTPQTTYTSSIGPGGSSNTNPIVLDSAGRTSSEVWLTQGVVYKFVLKTSTGTTLGTYDNVSGVNDFGSLAASSGSSLIGYLPVTGSATTVQAALRALQAADLTFALKGANTDITSLASPALASATATTQTAGDNTTKVATTAFVATAVGNSQIQPISASVAANALTISASGLSLAFRSTTLTSGTVTTVSGTPANLVVPSGATLGTVNSSLIVPSGPTSRLIVLALNNAGTIELGVVNLAGGTNLTETGLISTTAISAGATSASVVYSTTARTNVAYRVIGYIESTQPTAGTWNTTPSTVQGAGGQALNGMSTLGYGQTWQTVTRAIGTTYYNTTGKPIQVSITIFFPAGANATVSFTINGLVVATLGDNSASGPSLLLPIQLVIPQGATYVVTGTLGSPTLSSWTELR